MHAHAHARVCVCVGSPVAQSEGRVSLKVSKTAASRLSGWREGIVETSPLAFARRRFAKVSFSAEEPLNFIRYRLSNWGAGYGKTLSRTEWTGAALEDERAVLEVGSFRDAIGLGSNSFVGERGAERGEWSR